MDDSLTQAFEKSLELITAESFYGVIILCALLERILPRRQDRCSFLVRWVSNISLFIAEILLARVLVPGGLIAIAYLAQAKGWGLINNFELPALFIAIATLLLLDLLSYWEHRLIHQVPLLWRLHMVHHADMDVDFTTAFRHHPLEVAFGLLIGTIAIVSLGLSPIGILLFSLLAPIVATVSHANIRWNPSVDRVLRKVFITRDTHAVHHSARRQETDSNYGTVFIYWDWLFSTYRAEPAGGLDNYEVGLEYFRSPRDLALDRVLVMPFRYFKQRNNRSDIPTSKKPMQHQVKP